MDRDGEWGKKDLIKSSKIYCNQESICCLAIASPAYSMLSAQDSKAIS